jgi:hypothetical protein
MLSADYQMLNRLQRFKRNKYAYETLFNTASVLLAFKEHVIKRMAAKKVLEL